MQNDPVTCIEIDSLSMFDPRPPRRELTPSERETLLDAVSKVKGSSPIGITPTVAADAIRRLYANEPVDMLVALDLYPDVRKKLEDSGLVVCKPTPGGKTAPTMRPLFEVHSLFR